MADLLVPTAGLPLQGRRLSARQEEIVDVLEEVFAGEGLRAVTLGDLGRRARCSRRTLYAIAPSKEELFLVVLDRMLRRTAREARDAVAREHDAVERIAAFLRAGVLGLKPFSRAFSEAVDGYAPAGWLLDHHLTMARENVVALIDDAVARGCCRDIHPEVAAETLVAATRRLTEPSFLSATKLEAAEALGDSFSIITNGFLMPAGPSNLTRRTT